MTNRHRLDTGKGGLGSGGGRTENAVEAQPPGALGHDEDAAYGPDAAVERELPDDRMAGKPLGRNLSRRRRDGERDRKIEARALLA